VAAQVAPLITISTAPGTEPEWRVQVIVDPYDVGKLNYRAGPLDNNMRFKTTNLNPNLSWWNTISIIRASSLSLGLDSQRESLLFYEGVSGISNLLTMRNRPRKVFFAFGAAISG